MHHVSPRLESLEAHRFPESPRPIDSQTVIRELEDAGRTLLALPHTGPSTRLVQGGLEWIRDISESYSRDRARLRPAIPDAARITRMDHVLAWIPRIPIDKYVLRRIVGARCLVNPMTDRHLYSWRRLGVAMGADHKAVQRWHAQGIEMIVHTLRPIDGSAPGRRSEPCRNPGLPQPPRHHRGAHHG